MGVHPPAQGGRRRLVLSAGDCNPGARQLALELPTSGSPLGGGGTRASSNAQSSQRDVQNKCTRRMRPATWDLTRGPEAAGGTGLTDS